MGEKRIKLKLTEEEICSLFDILLITGGERKLLRENGLEKDYDSMLAKIEVTDAEIHKRQRRKDLIKKWVKRKTPPSNLS